jgi:hypothetical protein
MATKKKRKGKKKIAGGLGKLPADRMRYVDGAGNVWETDANRKGGKRGRKVC